MEIFETQLKFLFAFHLLTNGQIEVANHSLKNLLKSLMSEK